jgi:hypothetical protein
MPVLKVGKEKGPMNKRGLRVTLLGQDPSATKNPSQKKDW